MLDHAPSSSSAAEPSISAAEEPASRGKRGRAPGRGIGRGLHRWWFQRCGAREVLFLALPLVISTISWTFMHFVDRMFLLWHSPAAVAAAMPAGMLHWSLFSFPLGVALYATTFVAQYYGAGRPKEIGSAVWQAMRLGLYAWPLFLAVSIPAYEVFLMAGHDAALAGLEALFFFVLPVGAGPSLINSAQSTLFIGIGRTRVVMIASTLGSIINGVLDYLLIFGIGPFPELAIEGAAWAPEIAQTCQMLYYFWLMRDPGLIRDFGLDTGRRFDLGFLRRLFRFGSGQGMQFLLEASAFTMFTLLIGQLGTDAVAVTSLAMSINILAFLPVLSIGTAASTLVGQQLGRNRPALAERAVWRAMSVAIIYTGAFAAAYILLPEVFLAGHAAGAGGEFSALSDTVVVLLRFVAAYCFFDAMNVVFSSAVKGAGDTRFVLLVSALTSPLPLVIGYCGIHYAGGGLYFCWSIITGWICTLGIVYYWRFRQGRWKTMRVIEPEPLLDPPSELRHAA